VSAGLFALPPGYEAIEVRGATVTALASLVGAVEEALAGGTLYDWAAGRDGAQALAGRGTAWATTLPNGTEVVVRHSRHGGLLAPLTGDLFLPPSRAPRELATAVRLARAGVATPEVAVCVVYPARGVLCRADVATRTLKGADFPTAWRAAADEPTRHAILDATATLLRAMQRAGAAHPDLNLKNVFLTGAGSTLTAFVLDVDRIAFGAADDPTIAGRNIARVVRSARKWRTQWGLEIAEDHVLRLAAAAGSRPARAAK
jgi:3-deoxy-D-manno-octulosonic acid kinase